MIIEEQKKIYFVVYKTTNKTNGMIYIGVHATTNINDKYLGSGKNILKAIKKEGKQNFYKEILFIYNNESDMLAKEIEIVDEKFIARQDTYNIILGGGNYCIRHCVTVKDKNGKTSMVHKTDPKYLSGELIHNAKYSFLVKNKNNEYFMVSKYDSRFISGELVATSKGFTSVKDKDGKTLRVSVNDPRIKTGELVGVCKGRKISQYAKDIISAKNKINSKGEKNYHYGTKWVYNLKLEENKMIKKEELQKYLDLGWINGFKQKYNKKYKGREKQK